MDYPSSPPDLQSQSEPVSPVEANPQGCLGAAAWFGAAFVLPLFSAIFYYRAARSRLVFAMAFFFIFALALSSVQTLGLVNGIVTVGREIQKAYATGEFPIIRIQAGEARVDGVQPFILVNDASTLVAIDTTGVYTDIDRSRYNQGLLLTRRSLVYLTTSGEYQKMPLRDLQMAFDVDPIVLDAETALSIWRMFGVLVSFVGLFGLLLWNTFARLAGLLLGSLILWGLVSLIRKNTSFGEVMAPGIYAMVPAVYSSTLLSRLNIDFFGVFTLLTFLFWIAALILALYPLRTEPTPVTGQEYFMTERPLRAWRALIGLPLLLVLAFESIFGVQAWYISCTIALLSLAAFAIISLLPVFNLNKTVSLEAGGQL